MIDRLVILLYVLADRLRGGAAFLLALRGIMPIWDMPGVDEKYDVILKRERTAFGRQRGRP